MNNRLYLFDFDGTLTNKDTLFDFLQISFPHIYKSRFIKFIPLFLLSKFKLVNTEFVKQTFISSFLKGKPKEEINVLSQNYFNKRINSLIHPKALQYLKNIENTNDKYIVTASLDIWVEPFANFFGFRLISTKAEFKNQIFTGKFATPNCNGKEKVKRIVCEIQLSQFKEIYAFGDTKGDKYMLELSTNPHYKYFNS